MSYAGNDILSRPLACPRYETRERTMVKHYLGLKSIVKIYDVRLIIPITTEPGFALSAATVCCAIIAVESGEL